MIELVASVASLILDTLLLTWDSLHSPWGIVESAIAHAVVEIAPALALVLVVLAAWTVGRYPRE